MLPADTPVTVPDVPTVATPVAVLLHTPRPVASVREVVVPAQITIPPGGLMAAGLALTVIAAMEKQLPIL